MTRTYCYRVAVLTPTPDGRENYRLSTHYVRVAVPHHAALSALRGLPDRSIATVSEEWRQREHTVHGVWRRDGNRVVKD